YKREGRKEKNKKRLAQAHAWLFISSLINHRLTGEFTTDLTMAGTSQMLDLRQRDFSAPILQATGLPRRLFPRLVEAGQPIGALLPEAAALLGLPVGIPVISAGHDTQFALFGAGAGRDRLRFVNQRLPWGVSAPQQFENALEHAGGQPLHTRVIAARQGVQLAGGGAGSTGQGG
ncbi:hypothetical protein I8Q49_22315, partial [Acinetobacter baumannii]|nr:hypothetical protein [Acinetobacter baumannii]